MTISISTIKNEFVDYLEKLGNQQGKEYKTDDSLKSVFLYANEFENFLDNELGLTEEEIIETMHELSISLSNTEDKYDVSEDAEIEKLSEEDIDMLLESINSKDEEIEEGMETKEDDLNEESADVTSNETTEEETEKDLLVGILGEICKDEEFRGLIDTDKDGNINKEELLALIDTIKAFDTDEANLTLADLVEAGKAYKNGDVDGTFKIDSVENTQESLSSSTPLTAAAKGRTRTNLNKFAGLNQTIQNAELSLDQMNSAQLKEEVATRENALETAKTELAEIQEGTNDELKNLKAIAEESFKAYMEKLAEFDAQTAERFGILTQNKETINNNNIAIQNHNTTITTLNSELSNITSRKSTLQGKLSELQSAQNSEENKKVLTSITSKINTINDEINNLETKEKEITENKTKIEEEIKKLEEENIALTSENQGIEAQIQLIENSKTQVELQEYTAAKTKYEADMTAVENKKEELINKAQAKIEQAQKALNEAQEALTKQLEEEAQWKYSPNGLTDKTATAIEMAFGELGIHETGNNRGEILKYGGNAGDPWCASFVSWLYKDSPLKYNASVSGLRKQATEAGYYSSEGTYTPVPGDVMIMQENGAGHTGIVTGFDGEYVYTIEGNSGDAVRERRYRVGSSEYAKISGWIRMNEWCGGSSDIPTDTFIAQTNGEDAERQGRTTY